MFEYDSCVHCGHMSTASLRSHLSFVKRKRPVPVSLAQAIPRDFTGLSRAASSISFSAPPEDQMSIAASGDGLPSSEDEDSVGMPPSGVVATA